MWGVCVGSLRVIIQNVGLHKNSKTIGGSQKTTPKTMRSRWWQNDTKRSGAQGLTSPHFRRTAPHPLMCPVGRWLRGCLLTSPMKRWNDAALCNSVAPRFSWLSTGSCRMRWSCGVRRWLLRDLGDSRDLSRIEKCLAGWPFFHPDGKVGCKQSAVAAL